MSSSVVIITLSLLAALACLMTSVTSTHLGAVHPMVSLDQMEPEHACFFICSICFPEEEDSEHLLDCSNRVCGTVATGMCAMERFIWLGHHCRDYSMVENMWTSH